jgi:hypothetical protein
MRDWSISLPTWAYNKGYRLVGGMGTYDSLYLVKDILDKDRWTYLQEWKYYEIPNIFEVKEAVIEIEDKEAKA